jgi:hypothetical protein
MALTDNLLAYWAMDELRGTVVSDSSGNSEDGAAQNMTDANWVNGKINNCLSFDGVDQSVKVDDNSSFDFTNVASAMSISAWIYGNDYSSSRIIIDNENNWSLSVSDAGKILYRQSDTGNDYHRVWTTDDAINNRRWYHIVAVYDGGNAAGSTKIYIDNESVNITSIALQAGWSAGGNDLGIGISPIDFTSDPFDGRIDEVRVWDKELTTVEVEELYYMGAAKSGTIGQKEIRTEWPVEEGLTARTQKQTGRTTNLVPQNSVVNPDEQVLL